MKKILKIGSLIVCFVLVCAVLLVSTLLVTEYKPKLKEIEAINQQATNHFLDTNKNYSLLSWNLGYGALGDNADFFMDGGKSVNTASKQRVEENLSEIEKTVTKENPDFTFFQEIDKSSQRSHYINEVNQMKQVLKNYSSSFAYNFKVLFIPYPLPPIGQVNSGIATFSKVKLLSSIRYRLPTSFTWPTRAANLKRCLLINEVPVKNSTKKLVFINLHLEAYDSGDAKIMQTQMLKKVMDEEVNKGNYVIAGGDFNQTFSSVKKAANKADWMPGVIDVNEFKDYQCIMDQDTFTCRSLQSPIENKSLSEVPQYAIDGFIVSKNIHVDKMYAIEKGFKNTDHNPIKLQFKLNA